MESWLVSVQPTESRRTGGLRSGLYRALRVMYVINRPRHWINSKQCHRCASDVAVEQVLKKYRRIIMATVHGVTTKMRALFEYLDGLSNRAEEETLGRLLRELDISSSDVRDFIRFDEHQYSRNLIRGNEHYQVLLLCWRSGHRTPIHNHPGAVGGVRALKGVATETLFEFTPSGLIKPTSSRDLEPGGVVTLEDPYIHQVSNLQEAGADLITLHVYSPPLPRMDTYSLTDTHLGEFRPTAFEHALGSGI